MSTQNTNDNIVNRICYIPACSTVPQATVPLRATVPDFLICG